MNKYALCVSLESSFDVLRAVINVNKWETTLELSVSEAHGALAHLSNAFHFSMVSVSPKWIHVVVMNHAFNCRVKTALGG